VIGSFGPNLSSQVWAIDALTDSGAG
jgi:hypothetical protein